MRQRRARPVDQRQHGGLFSPEVRRDAGDRGWPCGVPDARNRSWEKKGAGEAGIAGAAKAAVANAANDALRPLGATITEIPLTPQVILTALERI